MRLHADQATAVADTLAALDRIHMDNGLHVTAATLWEGGDIIGWIEYDEGAGHYLREASG
jgi:hypothetical protein